MLKALGLVTLASLWEESNFAWPWPQGTEAKTEWPVITELSASTLTQIEAEFGERTATGKRQWRKRLAALPDDAFVDYDGDASDEPDEVREELEQGLKQLAGWVKLTTATSRSTRRCVAPHGNSLILIMDGDQ